MANNKFFTKKVDMRSRKKMIAFLTGHFRYDTMNSWNGTKSYANCAKLERLGLTSEQKDKAYQIYDMPDVHESQRWLIEKFAYRHNGRYTVGFNGRSSGYLVLYGADEKGRTSFKSMGSSDPLDYEDYSIDELRDEVRLVQAFDQLCDELRDDFIYYIENYDIVDEVVAVEHTIKVLQPKAYIA